MAKFHKLIINAVISFDIFLLVMCVAKLSKLAFKGYIGLTVSLAVLRIITVFINAILWEANVFGSIRYAVTPFIIKGILLFVIYVFNGKSFGGINSNESVSQIRARKQEEN